VEDVRPSRLHVFSYSDRKGTVSYGMKDKVPPETVKRRADELIRAGEALRREFAAGFIGRQVEVLIEQKDEGGSFTGYTGEYVDTRIQDPSFKKGDLVKVVGTGVENEEPVLSACKA
jgi:threonylcarbamoyladenosine tRNA methylthiotransferase MtaB